MSSMIGDVLFVIKVITAAFAYLVKHNGEAQHSAISLGFFSIS